MEYGYKDKVAVVTGAASGMGKEVADLLLAEGAKVYALDMNKPDTQYEEFIELNLASKESIDAAVAQLPEKVDTIFACAGVAGKNMPELLVTKINFIGHYHLIESLIPRMNKNSSIGLIASMGGMGWMGNIPALMEFLQNDTFEKQVAFLEPKTNDPKFLGGSSDGSNRGYTFSKEATIVYAKKRAWEIADKQIRINTISPGATQTPMLSQFGTKEDDGAKNVSPIGVPSQPIDQAKALLYLNSEHATYISGADLVVDYGYSGGIYTGVGNFYSSKE